MASASPRRDGRTGVRAFVYDQVGKVIVALVAVGSVLAYDATRPAPAPAAPQHVLVPDRPETATQPGVLIPEKETQIP